MPAVYRRVGWYDDAAYVAFVEAYGWDVTEWPGYLTLADEWAYARPHTSEAERRAALDPWLHLYNHHRGHTALGGQPPASRVTNLSGQYTAVF